MTTPITTIATTSSSTPARPICRTVTAPDPNTIAFDVVAIVVIGVVIALLGPLVLGTG